MKGYITVRIKAVGHKFVNGIANVYDLNTYPIELSNVISQDELKGIISKLNHTLTCYWPCSSVFFIGYICIPCTAGLSLFCPSLCVSEAEKQGNKLLNQYTLHHTYYDRNIAFCIKKGCCNSYVEISFPEQYYHPIGINNNCDSCLQSNLSNTLYSSSKNCNIDDEEQPFNPGDLRKRN